MANRKSATKSLEPVKHGEPEMVLEEDGDEEDDDVPEEEYEVDKVLDHRKGAPGKYTYLVSWKGYGPEHNTWEPQDNLEHANNLVSDYWAKQPKTELGVKKRGRQSEASPPAPKAAKASRQSAPAASSQASVRNGQHLPQPEDESEDDGADFVKTHVDSIDKYADVKDWEKVISEVDTIERGSDNQLLVFMTMVGGERVAQPTAVAYARAPQKLLKFYESHLKWRVGD